MKLHDIESSFMDSLMTPSYEDSIFLELLKAGKNLVPERQLDIYRSNLNGAYQKVIRKIYPACFSILGEGYFNQLCRAYRVEFPSDHPDLNLYGNHFPEFISDHVSGNSRLADYVYLGGLAELEWFWHAAYYREDDMPFDFQGLQDLDDRQQPRVCFHLSPSFSLHASNYPVIDIWQANRGEPEVGQQFEHDGSKICYCIHRCQYEPIVRQLDEASHAFLTAIVAGQTMDQLVNQFGAEISSQLPVCINDGWISKYSVAES